MQTAKRRQGVLLLGSLALLLLTLGGNFIINKNLYISSFFDYDGSAEIMLAKTMAENGEWIFSSNWFYSSEVRFLHNQLIMAFLFRFIENPFTVHLITTVVLGIFIAASATFCFRGAGVGWWKAVLAAALCVTAFSTEWFNNNLSNCYYSFFIADTFLFIGLLLRINSGGNRRKKAVLSALLCVFSVLLGLCGVRYALLVFLPITAVFLLKCLPLTAPALKSLRDGKTKLGQLLGQYPFSMLLLLLGTCVFFAVGFSLYQGVVLTHYAAMDMDRLAFALPENIPSKLLQAVGAVVKLLSPGYGVPVLSRQGMLHVVKLAGLGLIVLSSFSLFRQRKALPEKLALYVNIAWAIFFVNLAACIFSATIFEDADTISPRYMILALFPLVPMPALWLCSERLDIVKRALCTALAATLLLVNPAATYTVLQRDPVQGGTSAHLNADLLPLVDQLIADGYTSGYTDFHFSGIINLYSGGRLVVAAVDGNESGFYVSSWLQPMDISRVADMDGPQIMVLPRSRYDNQNTGYYAALGEDVEITYYWGHILALDVSMCEIELK